jgi:hypothetical protein
MALVLADRAQQTGTANTTVSFTLSATVTGYQSFAVVGNGNTTYYAATDTSGNWEVGIGTYATSGPTLTRTTILASSNSGSAVTFSGTVTVFITYPSEKSVNQDASGNVTNAGTITGTVVASSNGVLVNSDTVSSSYTISTGNNGFSVGPITVNSGVTLTVASGQRYIVI